MKYYLLLGAIPLLLILSYRIAFSETRVLWQEIKHSESTRLKYPDPDGTLSDLQKQFAALQKNHVVDPQVIDEQLMDAISKQLDHFQIRLEEIPRNHQFVSENYQVQTFQVRLSGSYRDLVRFIHYTEYEIKSCQLVSLCFSREMHRKRGEKLYADLYFQSIHKIK